MSNSKHSKFSSQLARLLLIAGIVIILWTCILSTTGTQIFLRDGAHGQQTTTHSGHIPHVHLPLDHHANTVAPGPGAGQGAQLEDDKPDAADRALTAACANTTWVDGLWLSCHSGCGSERRSMCGGLNNARNRIQTCMRLAIDIGAGVAFPRLTRRSEEKIGLLNGTSTCPDMVWNMDMLRETMTALCPQMKIKSCEEAPKEIGREMTLARREYKSRPHTQLSFRKTLASSFEKEKVDPASVTAENPLLLRFADSFLAWDYRDAGELDTLRKALFRALPFNETLLRLSDELLALPGLAGGNFIGVHLRAEKDWPAHWGTPSKQMEVHGAEAEAARAADEAAGRADPVRTIYVSCGDRGAIGKFRDKMAPRNFTVTDKWTLLADDPERLGLVDKLSFDDKAIVEYRVLTEARFFQGNLKSTMSALVVYDRTKDQVPEFWAEYIYPGSYRFGNERWFDEQKVLRGDEYTKIFVVDGVDVMDAFP